MLSSRLQWNRFLKMFIMLTCFNACFTVWCLLPGLVLPKLRIFKCVTVCVWAETFHGKGVGVLGPVEICTVVNIWGSGGNVQITASSFQSAGMSVYVLSFFCSSVVFISSCRGRGTLLRRPKLKQMMNLNLKPKAPLPTN